MFGHWGKCQCAVCASVSLKKSNEKKKTIFKWLYSLYGAESWAINGIETQNVTEMNMLKIRMRK